MTQEGKALIADFGCAAVLDTENRVSHGFVLHANTGTPAFMVL